MCGIFGVNLRAGAQLPSGLLHTLIKDLFILSESRGKEAAGLAVCTPDNIQIYKDALPADRMLRSRGYRQWAAGLLGNGAGGGQALSIIGHSRMVTNGALELHDNNQPVISHGVVGIHNGIIVNDQRLWAEFPDLQQQYQVDTEIILSLIHHFTTQSGSPVAGVQQTFARLEGTASLAALFQDRNSLVLATNNGSLYTAANPRTGLHIFASERYILQVLLARSYLHRVMDGAEIRQLPPGAGCILNIPDGQVHSFLLDPADTAAAQPEPEIEIRSERAILDVVPPQERHVRERSRLVAPSVVPQSVTHRFEIDVDAIRGLRRCTRCVLPETLPFIEFDDQGVCSYCRNYRPIQVQGLDALRAEVDRYRSADGSPDCLITFSGGRDSSYGVHYAVRELGLHPVTYTYDWGMVTDLARRNQARICGKLGLEHILVSADIARKRSYIRKNVSAWLKKPDLGTVPLFMAGDKQFFYYANQLRRQMGIDLVFLCVNPLEWTDFKTGFCGIRQPVNSESHYALSMTNQIRLAFYYARQYLTNPAYINASLLDTVGAFFSYYAIPHNFLNLYRYLRWEEEPTVRILLDEYDWEVAGDTRSTWRIGDGTASFYNYIYYAIAGFTENDTFRSNQIREGQLDRDQALDLVYRDNQPRFDSIQWYCDTIGIDMPSALERINVVPKLYQDRGGLAASGAGA